MKQIIPAPKGFWKEIIDRKILKGEKIFVLAPMADVTDQAFRIMIAKYSRMNKDGGGPDVMWNEFVSADGLCSEGRKFLCEDLKFTEDERPIVAQLFTSSPSNMYEAVKLCKELGYDGVDINMGCPVQKIGEQGCGAYLIKTPDLAVELIKKAQLAAGDMPITVKTRIGYNEISWREWLPHILSCGIPALTVHLRTKKEMSLVPAHWEIMKDIVNLVREMTGEIKDGGTIIIGNGDVIDLKQGERLAGETGADGVMIGRGVFGKPYFFDKNFNESLLSVEHKLEMLLEHTKLYEQLILPRKSFAIMKKHYKAYVNGFVGAKNLRIKLMNCNNVKEVENEIQTFLQNQNSIFSKIKKCIFNFLNPK